MTLTTDAVITSIVCLVVAIAAATGLVVSLWRDRIRRRLPEPTTTITTSQPYPVGSVILVDNNVDNDLFRVVSCTQEHGQGPYTLTVVRKGKR